MEATLTRTGAISADSHVTEPPNLFVDHLEPRYRDRAPHMIRKEGSGEVYVIPGMKTDVPYGRMAAAGKDPKFLEDANMLFSEIHRGGWDGKARLADQDRDGVVAEIIFPTVAMLLANHPDADYKRACFDAYNRWILEFQEPAPDRLICLPCTSVISVDETIREVRRFKDQGFRGVIFPGMPGTDEDYDHPSFEPLWSAIEELDLPINFHVFAGGKDSEGLRAGGVTRGPAMNRFNSVIRANQDLIGMFVLSGIFERHPKLKLVGVEGDAGWAPHFAYRMDHAWEKHRYWLKAGAELKEKPSHYFNENVYLTFQDDWVAFKVAHLMNPRRLLWANDFPHSDATWPHSQALLAEHARHLSEQERNWILRDNTRELYKLDV